MKKIPKPTKMNTLTEEQKLLCPLPARSETAEFSQTQKCDNWMQKPLL